jgi:hypothetical protein
VTWRPARVVGVASARTGWYRPPLEPVGGSALPTPDWSVWIQIWSFEYKFDHFYLKNWKKSKKINSVPHSHINTVWDPKKSKKIKPSSLFYVSYFKFLYNYFLNFVVQKINSKMVKSGIVVLTRRDKVDADGL